MRMEPIGLANVGPQHSQPPGYVSCGTRQNSESTPTSADGWRPECRNIKKPCSQWLTRGWAVRKQLRRMKGKTRKLTLLKREAPTGDGRGRVPGPRKGQLPFECAGKAERRDP